MTRYLTSIQTENLVAHVSRQYDDDDCIALMPHFVSVDFGDRIVTICDCHLQEVTDLLWLVERYLKQQKETKTQ